MNLRGALSPVSELPGMVVALVFTYDGLLVDLTGSRFAADQLAAELAGLADAARSCFATLSLGDVRHIAVSLSTHDVTVVLMPGHYLALVFERGRGGAGLPSEIESALQPLRAALGGRQ